MGKLAWVSLFLAMGIEAQNATTICATYESTVTFTELQTFYETCLCSSSSGVAAESTYSFLATTGAVILPNATIVPSSSQAVNASSTSTEASSQNTVSSKLSVSSPILTLTSTSSISSASLISSTFSTSPTTASTTPSATSTAATTGTPGTSSVSSSAQTRTSSTSVGPVEPIVTDEAYIDTILRHHNIHRLNHTASPLLWSTSLAETAEKIASSCSYGHVVNVDGGGYGQNIGAGFVSTQMGSFITGALYNSEVNSYDYYGGEPDFSTLDAWGHFTQIVWKNTGNVGCFTQDCSSTGLKNVGSNVPPYFTVCNYSPPGNVVGAFAANVGLSIGMPTIYQDYGCPSDSDCV